MLVTLLAALLAAMAQCVSADDMDSDQLASRDDRAVAVVVEKTDKSDASVAPSAPEQKPSEDQLKAQSKEQSKEQSRQNPADKKQTDKKLVDKKHTLSRQPDASGNQSTADTEPASTQDKVDSDSSDQLPIAVDVDRLEKRLKDSDAIGFFTKIAIRNDIVDLVDQINHYRKKSLLNEKMAELRSSFDGLLLKIVALLEDDPSLSHDLYVSRESIWKSLLEVKA